MDDGHSDRQLDAVSRELLDRIGEMRDLEGEKRRTQRSSPEFHALAEQVDDLGREVYRLASEELEGGTEDSGLLQDREDSGPGDWTRHSRA